MVREVETDDGIVYQCGECGRTFDDADEAESHESSCFRPPGM